MKLIQKPIVIVGAGFAGMTFALSLKRLNPSLTILVVDSESKFIFKPLMYEVLSNSSKMLSLHQKKYVKIPEQIPTFLFLCLKPHTLEV